MRSSARTNDDLQKRMSEIATLRDQIRVDLHLAGMSLRDEWQLLERKLPATGQALGPLKNATREVLDALADELRRFGERLRNGAQKTVAAIMTREPVRCSPDDSLARVLTTMWDRDVGCMPVVDGGGTLVGMLTDRDAAIAAASRGRRMDDIRVDSVMSLNVAACAPDAAYDEALGLMSARQVRRLPVVGADGHLLGIVTLNDIARALGSVDGSPHHSVVQQIVNALQAIARPAPPDGARPN